MNSVLLRIITATVIAAGSAGAAFSQETTLRVNVFPTATYMTTLLMGMQKGVFARRGLKIEMQTTPNSEEQRAGLAAGKFDIAHAAVDNAVAMVEVARHDVIIVLGGDSGMNEFMVRSSINSFEDIRGKVVAVDAPNTAYALIAKKILKNRGLIEHRDYTVRPVGGTLQRSAAMVKDPALVAGMVNAPFSFTVAEQGLKSLGRAKDFIGPYQAGGAFMMRAWAKANAAVLERYIACFVESARMVMDPANRAFTVGLLVQRFKLDPKLAEQTYDALMIPDYGMAKDARFSLEGFRTVLALRAELEGQWGGKPPAPDKYIDLGYYDRAMKLLGN